MGLTRVPYSEVACLKALERGGLPLLNQLIVANLDLTDKLSA